MKEVLRCIAVLAVSGAASLSGLALELAPFFREGAILQRDREVPVWGWAQPGEAVTVSFHAQRITTQADADGRWLVRLAPEPASAEPAILQIMGATTEIAAADILVGDVWLCSGQSNMEWPVAQARDPKRTLAEATSPAIRHYRVPKAVAAEPQRTAKGGWERCSPETVGDFSAVAYFFGQELHAQLQVPIGLLHSSWGGTQIESWLGERVLRAEPAFAPVFTRWQERLDEYPAELEAHAAALARWSAESQAASAAGKPARRRPLPPEGPGSRWQPAGLYNAMIHPFVPAALRGVIWYQGETNAVRHEEYAALFTALIRQWREDFGQERMPFYFVQLANVIRKYDPTGEEFSWLREAQRHVAATVPGTGMAVTIDIGEARNIHPANKQDVGSRLARLALAHTYGKSVEYSGPTLERAQRVDAGVMLRFKHATGLQLRPTAQPPFELAGDDGIYHPAQAEVTGQEVKVISAVVARPVWVRYAWGNNPPAALFNGEHLPASPFVERVQ